MLVLEGEGGRRIGVLHQGFWEYFACCYVFFFLILGIGKVVEGECLYSTIYYYMLGQCHQIESVLSL